MDYVDFAEYYDYDHDIHVDIEFYLDFARQCGASVLEVACGTGRVLIPLARAGFKVSGIDSSANMLERCRRAVHLHQLDERVNLNLAVMTNFDLPRKDFPLVIIPLRSFMHLLTQSAQLACLQRVFQHLRPGGQFILTAIAPEAAKLAQPPDDRFVVRREFDLPDGHRVVRRERLVRHDRATQVRHFQFSFEEFDAAGNLVRERVVPLWTRYLFLDEARRLLEQTGFQVREFYRDYRRNPYDGTGEMIVVACRPRERE